MLLWGEFAHHGPPAECVRVHAGVWTTHLDRRESLSIDSSWEVSTAEPLCALGELLLDLVKLFAEVLGRLLDDGDLLGLLGGSSLVGRLGRGGILEEFLGLEHIFVEACGFGGRCGLFSLEHLDDLIDAELAMSLVVSGSHIDQTFLHLLLTSHQDVVPLGKLRISHLLVDLSLGAVNLNLVAKAVVVKGNGFTVR